MTMSYPLEFNPNSFPLVASDDFPLYDEDPDLAISTFLGFDKTSVLDQVDGLLWDFGYTGSSEHVNGNAVDADMDFMDVEGPESLDIESEIQNRQDQAPAMVYSPVYSPPEMNSSAPRTGDSSNSNSNSRRRCSTTMKSPPSKKTNKPTGRRPSQEINKDAHNKVEKRYRLNINAKFAALNDVLPTSPNTGMASYEINDNDSNNYDGSSVLSKQTSTTTTKSFSQQSSLDIYLPPQHRNKGAVLSDALTYIKQLEERNNVLNCEMRILKNNFLEHF